MAFPFFTIALILIILFQVRTHQVNIKEKEIDRDFWKREHDANFTRKKSLDSLSLVHIPADRLPFSVPLQDAAAKEAASTVQNLVDQGAKIANLTGLSNTDLKLEWGTANLPALTEFDDNYTTLVKALHAWGKGLFDAGFYEEAAEVLEFSVSTRSDIRASYELLVDLYQTKLGLSLAESRQKIAALEQIASQLSTLNKNQILRFLQEALPADGQRSCKKHSSHF